MKQDKLKRNEGIVLVGNVLVYRSHNLKITIVYTFIGVLLLVLAFLYVFLQNKSFISLWWLFFISIVMVVNGLFHWYKDGGSLIFDANKKVIYNQLPFLKKRQIAHFDDISAIRLKGEMNVFWYVLHQKTRFGGRVITISDVYKNNGNEIALAAFESNVLPIIENMLFGKKTT